MVTLPGAGTMLGGVPYQKGYLPVFVIYQIKEGKRANITIVTLPRKKATINLKKQEKENSGLFVAVLNLTNREKWVMMHHAAHD